MRDDRGDLAMAWAVAVWMLLVIVVLRWVY